MKKNNIFFDFICITLLYWAIVILAPIVFSLLDIILPKRYQRGNFIPATACLTAHILVGSVFSGEHPVIVIFNSSINLLIRIISLYVWAKAGIRSQVFASIYCIVVISIFIFADAGKIKKNEKK